MGWLSKLFNLDTVSSQPQPQSKPADAPPRKTAKADACNRLKLVLMHDRTKISPGMLEEMRDEMVAVISKYVEIDKEALELNLETESNTIALVANIPLLNARPRTHGTGQTEGDVPSDAEEESGLSDLTDIADAMEAPKPEGDVAAGGGAH